MVKRLKTVILSVFMAMLSLSVLAGCQLGVTVDKVIEDNDLTAHVTYYANGGTFGASIKKKEIYYKSGSKAIPIGMPGVQFSSNSISVTKDNFNLAGWYFVKLDESGNPIVSDAENGMAEIDYTRPVDFSVRLNEGDHWIICADWKADRKVEFILVTPGGKDVVSGETTYNNGQQLLTCEFDHKNEVAPPSMDFVAIGGYTFTQQYFLDEACTKEFKDWPVTPEKFGADSQEDIKLYVKVIEGSWEIIKDTKGFTRMINNANSANKKYYLISDIDYNGGAMTAFSAIRCTIAGNGHKVRNATVTKSNMNTATAFSALGTIDASAVITDLKFENISVSVTMKQNALVNVYALITDVADGATVSGIEFKNVSMNITLNVGSTVLNIQQVEGTDTFDKSNWLFGGSGTDAQFLTEFDGKITLTGTPADNLTIE